MGIGLLRNLEKNKKSLIIIGILLCIFICAIIFSGVTIEKAPIASAKQMNATKTISGAWSPNDNYEGQQAMKVNLTNNLRLYHNDERVDLYIAVTFKGEMGALFRNSAIRIYYRCKMTSPSHSDYGGMSMSSAYFSTESYGKKDCDWTRTLSARPRFDDAYSYGTQREFDILCNAWSDDDKIGIYNWDTDSNVTCDLYIVKAENDIQGPTVTASDITYVNGDKTIWTQDKEIEITIKDNLAGANLNTLKINNSTVSNAGITYHERGRNVIGIFYTVTSMSNENLSIQIADFFGNYNVSKLTIGYIDNERPEIKTDIHAVDGYGTEKWTNGNATIRVSVQDANSGIKELIVGGTNIMPSDASTPGKYTSVQTREISVPNVHNYTGNKVVDHAGNEINLSSINITKIDKTPPILNYYVERYVDDNNWTNNNVSIYFNIGGVSANNNTVGISPMRDIDPIVVNTPNVIPPQFTYIMPIGGTTMSGFSYTHYCELPKANGNIRYEFQAYDAAGNASPTVAIVPNIDTIPPFISSVELSGKKFNGEAVNASQNYSYSNISVKITCAEGSSGAYSGISGIYRVTILGPNGESLGPTGAQIATTPNQTSFNFPNIITEDSITRNRYRVRVEDRAGNFYIVDGNTFQYFYPLKDATIPMAKAIGENDWENAEAFGQNISVQVWTGLSGGQVFIKRTYLENETIRTVSDVRVASFQQGTNMYENGNRKFVNAYTHNVMTEGEEYYHFMVVSGSGVSSGWKGLGTLTPNTDGANEEDPDIFFDENSKTWRFLSNGARTRIDNTPPQITEIKFTNGSIEIAKSRFTNPSNYIAESILGKYAINDGIAYGGTRTNGLNCSGLASGTGNAVHYTVTEGLIPRDIGIMVNDGEQRKYNDDGSFYSKAKFDILFSNQGLIYDGTIRNPAYTIYVTDRAGNVASVEIKPYIDDADVGLTITSVQTENGSILQDYVYTQEHNWTKLPIIFNFEKTFGQSGADISWYVSTDKETGAPHSSSTQWISTQVGYWGNITDYSNSILSSIRIPANKSIDATVFFLIKSKAKKANGESNFETLEVRPSGLSYLNFYIAIDNSPPSLDYFEFRDNSGNIIDKDAWSPTLVRLFVYANDYSLADASMGSGIVNVKVNIRYDDTAIIPMEMVNENSNVWRSKELLSTEEYQISIEDKVGNKTSAYDTALTTWSPKIDTQKPTLVITGDSYDALRGDAQNEATPIRMAVKISASSNNIVSGGRLYFKTRTVGEFVDLRFSEENIDLLSQGWQTREDLRIGNGLSLHKQPYFTIGGDIGDELYLGYDFVLISGSGLMSHIEYGTIWVDRKAPELNFEKIEYIRDDGQSAQNVIVPLGQIGSWTNGEIIAKLYIEDGENGSGINSNSITLNNYAWEQTEGLSELNNGYYIFTLDMFTEYVLKYADNAGNTGSYTIRPLIDRKPVSISLNATDSNGDLYNINPLEPGGVHYVNRDVIIRINLLFGDSAFSNIDIENRNYLKGKELYKLRYSLDGGETFFIINEQIGFGSEWTNPIDGSRFVFVSHDSKGAIYQMYLTQDQNREYYFEVSNGIEQHNTSEIGFATTASPMYAGQPLINQIKIDQTPPTITNIFYVNNANVNEAVAIDQWTEKSIRAVFSIEDNEFGSGVKEDGDRSVIVLKRDTNIQQDFIERVPITKSDGLYSFVMNGYYNYYIEFEDNVGNGRKTADYGSVVGGVIIGKTGGFMGPILPLIDNARPSFLDISALCNGVDYILPNGEHPWTFREVTLTIRTTVGLSGQKLQYQLKAIESNEWSAWQDVTGYITQENGIVQPNSGLSEKTTIMRFNNLQFEQSGEYRFRVVSGAGVISQNDIGGQTEGYYAFGNILIDTVVPTITATASSDNKTYMPGTWASKKIDFTITVTRGKSGSIVEVSNNQIEWSISNSRLGEISNATFNTAKLTRTFDSETFEGDRYYFRVRSGAGREVVYNFGYVKKDEGSSLNVTATFRKVNSADILYSGLDQIDFATTFNEKGINHQSDSWSSTYILIKLNCSLGNSGAFVQYSDEIDGITGAPIYKDALTLEPKTEQSGYVWLYNGVYIYNQAMAINSHRDPLVQDAYILIKENQNRRYKFRITSYSGVSKNAPIEYSVMIDKTVPYMTLSISDDSKSVKWVNDDVNDLHKWHITEPIVTFHIGKYDEGGVFEYGYPISNASVYYRESYINAGGNREYKVGYIDGIESYWLNDIIQNNGLNPQGHKPTMKIVNNVDAIKTYEFKIVTGAGLEFEIFVEYSNPNNLEGKNLWTKSLASDEIGMYTIKVDTTEYIVSIEQWLKQYKELDGVNTADMAMLTMEVNGELRNALVSPNGEIIQTRYGTKRGDRVSISISENAYDEIKGYGYIFKRVEFYGDTLNGEGNEYLSMFYNLQGVSGEFFEFDIYDSDYSIMSYFTKEIKIDFHNLYQIMQIEDIEPVEVISPHSVSGLKFEVSYTGTSHFPVEVVYDNSLLSPREVGEYTIKISRLNDNPNDPNYLIHNSGENELINQLIVYYDNKGTNELPIYYIFNQQDLEYVNIYNDTDSRYEFLAKEAIIKTYIQQVDFAIDNFFVPIYGSFRGVYNGNNKEIFSTGTITAQGSFGIFESIINEVTSLGIRLSLLQVFGATNAGFLAGDVSNGARISHCYAIGEMEISGFGVNVGGLIGYAYNQAILNGNYADVSIKNKGNELTGNVGGIVGKIDYIEFIYNYCIGPIELYDINSNQAIAGALVGSIISVMEDNDLSNGNELFYSNKYAYRNLFINEEIEENGGFGYMTTDVYTSGNNEIEGLAFSKFLLPPMMPSEINIANIPIASINLESKHIKNLAIGRMRQLGLNYGLGSQEEPFHIDSRQALSAIDRYVWADYIQTADIYFEKTDAFETISAYKVFYGNFDGYSGNNRYKIDGINIETSNNNAGIFGKVSGTIKNMDIRNLNIVMNYDGNKEAFAGGVASKLDENAELEYIFVVGNVTANAPNTKLYIGGIAGHMVKATLRDILSMANVITREVRSLDIGGTVGYIQESTAQKVYSLARVEANFKNTGAIGAVVGTLIGQNNITDCFALNGNTYAHMEGHGEIVGNNLGEGFSGELLSLEEMRVSGYSFMTDPTQDLDTVLSKVYPFSAGNGTAMNPFLIYTVQEFNLISDFLYAHYRLKNDIAFDNASNSFKTIGVGARFTGTISGVMSEADYLNIAGGVGPRSYSLSGVTDSLVYYNVGQIQDLRITINYDKVFYENVTFGAVAKYNSGTIQSVYVDGTIKIKVNDGQTAIVGGFVGEDFGGKIFSDYGTQEPSYDLSSINEAKLIIIASQIEAGGFIGRVSGSTKLSYLVSEGNIECSGGSVLAGTIVGVVANGDMTFENEIESSAVVIINGGEPSTEKYGVNIND